MTSAEDFWLRAVDALKASRHVLSVSPDTAAGILRAVADANPETFRGLEER